MSQKRARILAPCAKGLALLGLLAAPATLVHADDIGLLDTAAPTTAYVLPATTVEGNATHPITSFDISFVDNFAGIYLLADRSNKGIDVVDLNFNTASVISPTGAGCTLPSPTAPNCTFQGFVTDPNSPGPINDVSGPNGVATVNHNEIWAGDAPTFGGGAPAVGYGNDNCDSSIKVINLRTQQVTDVINTGGCFRADEVAFDPEDEVFIAANDAEQDIGNPNFVTLISAKSHRILHKIVFDGTGGTPFATNGIEQPTWNAKDNKFYIAVPANGGSFSSPSSVGAVAVVNPTSGVVERVITVNNCTPNGIAVGPNNQAVLGCNATMPVQVIDLATGSVVASIAQVNGGCDEVWYEASQNHYLTACSQGATAAPFYVLGVIDAGSTSAAPSWDENIQTKPTSTSGASPHSATADDFSNRNLVPMGAGNSNCPGTNGCIGAWVLTSDHDDPNDATYVRELQR